MLLRRLLLSLCSALAFATGAHAQGINLTDTILSAPPATYPPSPLDRIPIVQTPTSPGSVPGTYALTLPASLFAAAPFLTATSYSVPATGTDGTAQAQAALDAAGALAPSTLYFPNAFDFNGYLASYPGVNVICGGNQNQINRTGAGPGFYLSDSIATKAYPSLFVAGSITNCAIDGGGRPGSNFTFSEAYPYSIRNITGTGTDTAASQIMATINGSTLTVGSVDYGTVKPGQFLICQECGAANTSGNTYPIIQAYGTAGTSGTGGTGTYSITVAFGTPVTSNAPMITSTPWTWGSAPGRQTFPSANAYLLGATEVNWVGGFLGNSKTATSNTCTNFNGIGLVLDSPRTNGGGKPNANYLAGVIDQCNLLGMGVFNGGDNVFTAGLHQNDPIAEIYGGGANNATRNIATMMYYEPQSTPPIGRAGVIFAPFGTENQINGLGSTNSASFQPVVIDVSANDGVRNQVQIANDQTWHSGFIVDTFYTGFNQANPPAATVKTSRMLDGDDTHSVENAVKAYQAADVPMHVGYFQRGAHGSPAAVAGGDVLWVGGGRGQYDTTVNHLCDNSIANFNHVPCGFFAVVANAVFTTTSWPTRLEFYTTPTSSKIPALRWTIGVDSGLYAATLTDLGGGSVNMVWGKTKPVAFSTLSSCTSDLEGAFEAVTNSVSAVWGDPIVNGGANHVLAYCNGTSWNVAAK